MPGIVQDGVDEHVVVDKVSSNASPKQDLCFSNSLNDGLNPECPRNGDREDNIDGVVDTSIEQLYENVYEMQSSDHSPSRHSFETEDESEIDLELHHLVEGKMREVEIMEEDEEVQKLEYDDYYSNSGSQGESFALEMAVNVPTADARSPSPPRKASHLQMRSETSLISSSNSKKPERTSADRGSVASLKKTLSVGVSSNKNKNSSVRSLKLQNTKKNDMPDAGSDNPDLAPLLLSQARDLMASGDNAQKALDLATRAANSFEKHSDGKPSLNSIICMHVMAALYCSLRQYNEAIPVLEHSIEISVAEEGQERALAKFAGLMQLGDTYAMLGLFEKSISCYTNGLNFQKQVLGDNDPRIGETCRYLAEAHMQAMQFDEARKLCQMALDVHQENGSPSSLEEVADRKLMGMICESKGDHEAALEHLVLASMAMASNGKENEVASIDCSIGDAYLSLNRYDEADLSYQKALELFKSFKGENHPCVATAFVRLADLYNKTGKFSDSRSYCLNALQIYDKSLPGIAPEEIASGLTDIAAIYESMDEAERALELLQKAMKLYDGVSGQQNTVAAIESQIGIIYYTLGKYSDSYTSLKRATTKFRASGEKKPAFFGTALNQMGLACVQLCEINEALALFEESRHILEQENGQCHPDTLAVYSNLAGAYDAVGRVDDAIEFLELIIGVREEKLGTANPEVEDEKKRLAELLKEAGKVRNRKRRSLGKLLHSNNQTNSV